MTTWIICPNLRGVRLFEYHPAEDDNDDTHDTKQPDLHFVREAPRPDVQLRTEDFDTDEDIPELTHDEKLYRKQTEVAEKYMARISEYLNRSFQNHRFENLILCAEPHLLEILTSKLKPELEKRVLGCVENDLYHINESDLLNYVSDVIEDSKSKTQRKAAS